MLSSAGSYGACHTLACTSCLASCSRKSYSISRVKKIRNYEMTTRRHAQEKLMEVSYYSLLVKEWYAFISVLKDIYSNFQSKMKRNKKMDIRHHHLDLSYHRCRVSTPICILCYPPTVLSMEIMKETCYKSQILCICGWLGGTGHGTIPLSKLSINISIVLMR